LELYGDLVLSVIAVFLAVLIYTVYRFLNTFNEQLLQLSGDLIKEVSENQELQQSLYTIGGIIGSGVKGGVGLELTTKRGGKLRLEDIALQLIGQWFSSRSPSPSPTPLLPTQPINTNNAEKDFFNR
jgi:hypothetical protein